MSKNKLIAVAIVIILIVLPFQSAYIYFSEESQVLQVLSMAVVIIGSIIAILMYNKDTGESHH